jgi:ribosomal protein L17
MNRQFVFVASCLLIAASLTGCGLTSKQIIKAQSFGTATTYIGKLGEEEFVNIRNEIIEMNKELVSIDNTKTASDLVFDRPTSPEETATRIAAAKALRSYGELLVKLATEDRTENLEKVANSLINNTSAALKKDLSDEKKGAINKIFVGLGSFWVEKKKADAVREIIPAYEQAVNELADMLTKDFSVDDDALGYLKAYDTTAKRLKNASMRLVNAGDKYSVLERDRAVQGLVLSEKAITRANEISKKTKEAISGLKKANIELVKVIKEEAYSTDDIKEYAKQIQELVNMYQVLTK